jgi:hypothetical protein
MHCGHNGHASIGVVLINPPLLTSHPIDLQTERPNSQVADLNYNIIGKKYIYMYFSLCLNEKLTGHGSVL